MKTYDNNDVENDLNKHVCQQQPNWENKVAVFRLSLLSLTLV